MRRFCWAFVLVAGCFTPDLGEGQVACGAGGQCPPSYVCHADGRCYHDAGDGGVKSGSDLGGAGGDLAAHCDRDCPPTSTCAGGICAPPSGAAACARAGDCGNGEVCDEYNVGGMIHGFCTPPMSGAQGGTGASCSAPGYDASCKTGICAADAHDNALRACLVPCKNDNDCGGGGNKCQATVGQPTTIEGAPTVMLRFCANAGGG